MPLPPSGNTPWPPPQLEIPHADMDMWRAWYSGNTDHLAAVYGGPANYRSNATARAFFEVEQRRNAGQNELRMFWGQEPTPGQQAAKLHIPIAADIAELSANLLWSEVPQVTVDVDSTDPATALTTQAQIGRYLDDRGHAKLREGAELTSGLSNVYLRVVWDTTLRPRPWLDVIQPDAVIPEWRWGALAAATVWRELAPLKDPNEVWRLLEYHVPGAIEYGVYKGSTTDLGLRMDFTDHPDSDFLAKMKGVDTEGRQATGIDRLLITHLPNVLPNRVWEGIGGTAPLGRSDFAGVEPLMDALDESWTSWMRDLRLGKARVILPQSMLETDGPGTGGSFDLEQEVRVALNMLDEGGKDSISQIQFNIRVQEHEQTCKALRRQILASAGYSAQSMGEEGSVAVTATEIAARKEESLTTRGTKILYQRPALLEVLTTMMMVDVKHCGAKGVDPAAELTASWPQAVQPDPEATARTLSLLDAAGAISTFMKVKMRSPELDDAEVMEEVERIRDDKRSAMPAGDPFNIGGQDPNAQQDEEGDTPEAGADEGQDEADGEGEGDEPGLKAA
ncbi:phage portal protein [Streptomyces sp. NPDC056105]|uniref:phage portal protein n=1 Tax=Streptomyces sp. NPDC056105 TaxID=3345714 RepID=UPI0035D79063